MKRKLSLFLALCLMLGSISPALEAKAASVQQEEVQLVTEEEAETIEVTEELTESTDEELPAEDAADQEEPSNETETPEITDEPETPTEGEVPSEEGETSEDVIVPEKGEENEETEDVITEEVVPEEEPVLEEELAEEVIIEEVEEIQEVEKMDTSTQTVENGKFSGTWGADDTDIAVTAYSYGADFLIAQLNDNEYGNETEGTTRTDYMLLVEKAAGVDLLDYADSESGWGVGEEYNLHKAKKIDEVSYTEDGVEKKATVRLIWNDEYTAVDTNTSGTYGAEDYYKYDTLLYSIYGLEPDTEYTYLFVNVKNGTYHSEYSEYDKIISPALKTGTEAVQRSFKTLEAKESNVSISIEKTLEEYPSIIEGYSSLWGFFSFSGLNGQRIVECGLTSEASGDVNWIGEEDTYNGLYAQACRSWSQEVERTDNLPGDAKGTCLHPEWQNYGDIIHPFETGETTKQVTPYIVIREWTEDGYVDNRYEGDAVSVARKNIDDLKLDNINVYFLSDTKIIKNTTFTAPLYDEDLYCTVLYKPVTSETWEETYPQHIDSDDGFFQMNETGLTPGTQYEYKYQIYDSQKETVLKTFDGGNFTTESATTLTQEDIPDPALWSYLSNGAESISSSSLLSKTSLSLSAYHISTYGVVKDLTGIEYLKNLTSLSISGHGITDLTPVLNCSRLTSLQVNDNELTTLPDFSSMKSLTYINVSNNRIKTEDLENAKYPEGTSLSASGQKAQAVELSIGSTTVCKESKDSEYYTLKFTIDHAPTYRYNINLKIEDITDGEDKASVVFSNTSLSSKYKSEKYNEYNGYRYTITAQPTGMTLTEGNRTLRFTWTYNYKTYVLETNVTVDPNAVGGTWEISDEKLPAEVKSYMLSHYDMQDYDLNSDGIWSYDEVAGVEEFEIYSEDVQIKDFSFLKYMTSLEALDLAYQNSFTNETLATICTYDNVKNLKDFRLSNMAQITDLSPLTTNVKGLEYLSLWEITEIKDISSFAAFKNLRQLNLNVMTGLTGLSALKDLPLQYLYFDNEAFTDEEIFNFICNIKEVEVQAGKNANLVSTLISMKDTSLIRTTVANTAIADVGVDDQLKIYGLKAGETTATITYGDDSYTVNVKVTASDFDYDPAVGETVSLRMRFEGTEGLNHARVGRTLIDTSGDIWNLTTRTPEKVLEKDSYTKYASKILYQVTKRFSVKTPVAGDSFPMYLDKEGTLWAFTESAYRGSNNFSKRVEVMRNVADWQDGGYSQESYHSYYDDYLLVLRTDGSLWYVGYRVSSDYNSGNVITIDRSRIEKLEAAGTVQSVHTHSYLTKDGRFYQTNVSTSGSVYKKLIADDIVNVFDNSALTIVQDMDEVYYNECGKLNISSWPQQYLVGSYYNPEWMKENSYGYSEVTDKDILASYLLMEDGTLYRSNDSDSKYYKEWEKLDTGVTMLTRDYYWKGDTAYAYNGKIYAEYIGSGAGRGVYPMPQSDGTMTLYVNGIPYLTKVVDWLMADSCVYAIRTDNTLWQFDENNTPSQVKMSELDATVKDAPKTYTEIDITNLKNGINSITVEWEAVEGAASYNVYTGTNEYIDEMTFENVAVCSWTKTELSENAIHYFKIDALNSVGEVIGESWRFYTYTQKPSLTIDNVDVTLNDNDASVEITVTVGPSELTGDDYGLEVFLQCESRSEEETGEMGSVSEKTYNFSCTKAGTYKLEIEDLYKNAWYGGYVYLNKGSSRIASINTSFDTEPHQYLTEEDIPDAAFREILRNSSPELDLYALQKKTYLEIDDASIQDLTGLELLTGLTNLTLKGINPDIIDTSKFSAGLEYLYMTSCGLKEIPDLSGLPELKYLDLSSNEIPESEFTADNAALKTFVINYKEYYGADSLEYWLEEQMLSQLGDPLVYVSDVYYQTIAGNYPFMIEIAKVDGTHEYKLELYEGTKLTASLNEASGAGVGRIGFKVADAGISSAGEKELTYVVIDVTENKEVCRDTKTITYKDSYTAENEKQYIPVKFWSQYLYDISLSGELFDKLYNTGWNEQDGYEYSFGANGLLTDAAGKQLQVSYEVERNMTYPEEYEIFNSVPSIYRLYENRLYASILEGEEMHTLTPGACTLTVYGYDGKTAAIQLKDVIEVTSSAIINGVGTEREQFDIQGEYLYVGVYGDQLGAEPINMIITDKNGNNVSSKPYELVYSYSPTWKIHLDEEYREISNFYYEITDEGLLGETSGRFYVNRQEGYLYNLYGDDLKKELVGYASSALKDGTELTFVFYEDDGTEYKTVNATVKNREIHVPFTPGEENNYISNYRVEVYDGEERLMNEWISNGNIYNGDALRFSTKRVDYVRYFNSIIEVTGKAVIELRDPKDYRLITTLETTEDRAFTDMDLSAVEGGKLYYVVAKDDDSYAVRMGYFNVVTETNNLTFALTDHNGNAITAVSDNKYLVDYTSDMKGKVITLDVTTIGNGQAAIKATSSSTGVAAAKVSGKTINLTVKGTGTTNITVTALDSKYSEKVALEFRDHTPKFNSTTVAINKALLREGNVAAYPVYGTELIAAAVDETKLTTKEKNADYAKYFNVAVDGNSIHVGLNDTEKENPLKNGSYRLPLTITVDDKAVPAVLTVKLTNTKPKVTVKQNEKINLFYTDTKSVLTLTPNTGEISGVTLGDDTFFAITKLYDAESGTIELTPKSYEALKALTSKELSNALKIQLNITVGETTLTQKVTLSKATTKPSVSLSQASSKVYKVTDGDETFYIGKVLNFAPIDKKTKKVLEDVNVTLTGYSVTKKGVTSQNFSPTATPSGEMPEEGFVLNANTDESFTIYFVGNTTATATLMVQGDNWSEAIKTTYKVTVTTSKLSGKLATTKVSLNQKYAEDQKTVLVSAALPYESFELGEWTITPPKKSNYVDGDILIDKNAEGTGLTVSLKAKEESLKGTYKASIPVTFTFFDGTQYTPKNLSLTITVLDELLTAKALKWKTSGKLNTIDRENGVVTLTPTVSKVNAAVSHVMFSEADKAENVALDQKLDMKVVDGKVVVSLLPGVDVSTKDKYIIHPVVTLANEDGTDFTTLEAPAVTLKPTQATVKTTLAPKQATMYQYATGTHTAVFDYTLKATEGVKVKDVVLTNMTEYFEVEHDSENQQFIVTLKDSSVAVKTHTLKLQITFEEQATNAKPLSVSAKVAVKN